MKLQQADATVMNTKPMSEMEPLECGVIVGGGYHHGHVVMRTASEGKFEVMDLTSIGTDECWTSPIHGLQVRPLTKSDPHILNLLEN